MPMLFATPRRQAFSRRGPYSVLLDKSRLAGYMINLTRLNLDISIVNSVYPDQLASGKPADQDSNCFPHCLDILYAKNFILTSKLQNAVKIVSEGHKN